MRAGTISNIKGEKKETMADIRQKKDITNILIANNFKN